MKHLHRTAIVILAGCAPWAPAGADATTFPTGPVSGGGAFVVASCGESGSTQGWSASNTDPGGLTTFAECPPQPSNNSSYPAGSNVDTGLWASDRLGNAGGRMSVNAGERAALTFAVPSGTQVVRARWWRDGFKNFEQDWEPYVAVADGTVVETCEIAASANSCGFGSSSWHPNDAYGTVGSGSYEDLQGVSTDALSIGVYCRNLSGAGLCNGGSSLHEVGAAVYSAFFTIADPSAPSMGTPSGGGWGVDGWQQGTLPLAVSSADNTGISETRVYADGSVIATLQRSCSYDRPRPCTDEPTGSIGLPTAVLPDGPHTIQLAAVDAAGNETRLTSPRTLYTDNHAPAAPAGLAAPSATSATGDFSLSWSLPADSGTPITTAHFQLCQPSGCTAPQTAPSLTAIDHLALPAPGAYDVRVWLEDAMHHADPASAATLRLTYAPPPAPAPAPDDQQPATTDPGTQPLAPPPPMAITKLAPRLRITRIHRLGRRLTVTGTMRPALSGRLTIRYRVRTAGGHTGTLTRAAALHAGRFRATIVLPRALARARRGVVTVAYAGSATARATARSATIALAP